MKCSAAPNWFRPGQTIGLAAPASPFARPGFEHGLKVAGEMQSGLKVRADGSLFARREWLAGEDDLRARHLTRLFSAPEVGLIWAVRGGFGCSRLLPRLDLAALAQSKRCFLGFSDLTCLLGTLAANGLVALHGPTLNQLPQLDLQSRQDIRRILAGDPGWPHELTGRSLIPGKAEGPLVGGNLTLICHLLGTPWSLPFEEAILFLEDTCEEPYKLDRYLTQLELAGVPGMLKGVALGQFGEHSYGHPERELAVRQRVSEWGLPLISGLPFGHGPRNRVLPVGALARMDESGVLRVGVDLA